MMDAAIPEAKHTFPSLSLPLPRKRLFAVMDGCEEGTVILVTGQAAQGKSTLVGSYLRNKKSPAVWVHLDSEDSDPANLFFLLTTAVKAAFPGPADFPSLNAQPSLGAGHELGRYRDILRGSFQAPGTEFTLVLDDLETLEQGSSSLDLIHGLVEANLPSVRLILISRTVPPLGISKLKMAGRLMVLDNEDLAFTLDETREFFKLRLKSLDLTRTDIDRLHAITGGWAGGLVLLAESIRRTTDLSRLPEKLQGESLHFFAEEVFAVQPEPIRKFLVLASLFDPMDPGIIAEFHPEVDPLEIFGELERRNLFLHRLEAGPAGPVFRFNKLFRSFLLSRLRASCSEEHFRELSARAAAVYDERHQSEFALKYAIQAGDHRMTSDLITRIGTDLVLTGRLSDLAGYLDSLPDSLVWSNPWLIYFLTMTRRIKGGKRNIEDFSLALSLFRERGDTRGRMLALSHLIEALVFLQYPPDSIREWIRQGEELLVSVREETLFTYARTVLWLHMGFGCIAGTGDIARGLSACKNALLLAEMIGNQTLLFNALIVTTLGLVRSGEVERAEQELDRIGKPSEMEVYPEYRTLKNRVRIELLLKKGELDKAAERITILEKDIEAYGLIFQYPGLVECRALFHLYRNDVARALADADHLSDISILSGNTGCLGLAHCIRAMGLYHRHDFLKAEIEAEKALDILGPAGDGRQLGRAVLLHGLVLMHRKKTGAAESMLRRLREQFTTVSAPESLAEASCALGLVLWQKKAYSEALDLLCKGISFVITENRARLPVMAPMDFTRAVLLHAVSEPGPVHPHLTGLISDALSGHAPEEIQTLMKDPAILNRRAWTSRLRELFRLTLPRVRIETLGEFRVCLLPDTHGEIQWEGTRPKQLLKSIIVHGGTAIPKDILIEDLWPETSEASGEKKFKVTLHRLRKSLEPRMDKEFGYTYLTLEGGYLSLDAELVSVDCFDFLTLCARGKNLQSRGLKQEAMDCFEKASQMYRGDFLPEDPYSEWTAQKRNDFIRIRRDLLERMAELHELSGRLPEASRCLHSLIQSDPLLETGYQKLMHLYCAMGMKNRALKVYEQCRELIRKELGCEPDIATTQLYRTIRESGEHGC
jgi:ATP/maltotriose-dependent transcriptional regulator MalT/DNA-binding SARP family transcriptional activator